MAVPGAAERERLHLHLYLCPCLCLGPGISAAPLITARDWACCWGNRNNKPALIVGRDSQGMSRQSVVAAVPSCCRVTQWSNVVLHGQTCPCWRGWGDRDRLATRASPLHQVQARVVARHAPLRLRSGDMPERGALGPLLVIRHPPTGTVAQVPSAPCPSAPGPVGPALSSLLSRLIKALS